MLYRICKMLTSTIVQFLYLAYSSPFHCKLIQRIEWVRQNTNRTGSAPAPAIVRHQSRILISIKLNWTETGLCRILGSLLSLPKNKFVLIIRCQLQMVSEVFHLSCASLKNKLDFWFTESKFCFLGKVFYYCAVHPAITLSNNLLLLFSWLQRIPMFLASVNSLFTNDDKQVPQIPRGRASLHISWLIFLNLWFGSIILSLQNCSLDSAYGIVPLGD